MGTIEVGAFGPVQASPLWQQVRDSIAATIKTRESGDTLPGEVELAKTFGVSRPIVRRALDDLEHDHLVTRGSGQRTRIV